MSMAMVDNSDREKNKMLYVVISRPGVVGRMLPVQVRAGKALCQ